jgi:hypothetical protein
MTTTHSGNSIMPERVLVVFSNSHDTNFALWHFFKCQNALWLLQNIHDAKFRAVAVLILPQRVLIVFSLIERFPFLSVTHVPAKNYVMAFMMAQLGDETCHRFINIFMKVCWL